MLLHNGSGQRLTSVGVCERFGVTRRTLSRWLLSNNMNFPKPLMINGRLYFALAEIEVWERACAARAGKAA